MSVAALVALLRRRYAPDAPDAALLHAYAESRDEAAFRRLVARHGPAVLRLCRRLLGDSHAAEDAFQATFLILARRARTVRRPEALPTWLYGVARRVCRNARTARDRRQAAESQVRPRTPASPAEEMSARELLEVLDDELHRLPGRYREPLALVYWQGLTQTDAARRLGLTFGALRGRLERGRARLASRLERRGFAPGDLRPLLAAPLGATPVPPDLLAATIALAADPWSKAVPTAVLALIVESSKLLPAVALGVLLAGAGLVALATGQAPVANAPVPAVDPLPAIRDPQLAAPRVDHFGDPLPIGAVARLGTRRLSGPPDAISWAGFSPDGTKIASHNGRSVTVWDTATGRLLVERTNYWALAQAIGWRMDGTGVAIVRLPDWSYFVSAFSDPAEALPSPPRAAGPPGNPNAAGLPGPDVLDHLALSPDGARVALVRDPRGDQVVIDILPATLRQSLTAQKPERTLGPFPGPSREIRYMPDGRLVLLTGPWQEKGDWTVTIIDPNTNSAVRTTRIPPPGWCVWRYMLSLSADVRLAAFPLRTTLATGNHDGAIRVWDLAAEKELWSLPFPGGGYGTGHSFTPDGKYLITSTDDSSFQIWEMATGKEAVRTPIGVVANQMVAASAVAVSADGKRFATAWRDGRVDLWDTATGQAAVALATHRAVIDSVAVSPDGRLAATVGFDGAVRVWETATGKPECVIPVLTNGTPPGMNWPRCRPAFTPDGRGLLYAPTGWLALADSATGRPLDLPGRLRYHPGNIAGFTADGKTLATYTKDVVTFWDWPAGTARNTITVPVTTDPPANREEQPGVMNINSAALSPDGRFLFTHSIRWNGFSDVWDARTGKRLHRLATGSEVEYLPAAFTSDGRVLYLGETSRGTRERTEALAAWDTATGMPIRRFSDPDPLPAKAEPRDLRRMLGRIMRAVAVSPDGSLLAAAEMDMTPSYDVWLYETSTGGAVKKLTGHARWITDLAFTSDGRRLISVSQDQTGLVWDVTPAARGGGAY